MFMFLVFFLAWTFLRMSEKKKKDGEVIDDPRFSRVHTDRRFMKVPNFKKEAKSDPRFRALETDKRFGFAGKVSLNSFRLLELMV